MFRSVSGWIEKVLSEDSIKNQTAFITDNGLNITYQELLDRSNEMANALKGAGIKAGDHVAVWLPNSIDWIVLELSCGMIGATLVALNTRYRSHELFYILKQSDSKMLFFTRYSNGRTTDDVLKDIMPELFTNESTSKFSQFPMLRIAVCTSDSTPYGAWSIQNFIKQFKLKDELNLQSKKSDILNILYTSGSTSKPKGAMLSHQTVLGHSSNISQHLKISKADTSLEILPFCGIFGLNSLWASLLGGATIIAPETFQVYRVCELISEYKCTIFNAVDEMHSIIINYKKHASVDLSSLRIGTTGMFIHDGMEIMSQMEQNIDYRMLHTYGMSEIGSMLLLKNPEDPLETRVIPGGKPVSGKAKIIDPNTLIELSDNEMGEIAVSGINVMSGYYNAPENNKEAFLDDHYFRTGDLGIKHPDGTIEYHGRLREALRLSGFLVSPSEIEDFLNELEGIELSQVVGLENNQKTIIVGFIKLEKSSSLSVESIQNHCQSLAHFKQPKHFFIVDDFPKTQGPNGEKIVRNRLVEMAESLMVQQR